jgi:hypothetical protein
MLISLLPQPELEGIFGCPRLGIQVFLIEPCNEFLRLETKEIIQ